jgi:thiol-disulfide isomerase/thioredoxin
MSKAIILVFIILLFYQNAFSQTDTKPALMPESIMKAEFEPLGGIPTIRFPDYKGKIVVAFLWASWCIPCGYSVESLNILSKDFSRRGVEIIGLTFDDPKIDMKAVRKFIRQWKPKLKLGWIKYELANEWAQNKLIVPQFIVFTGDGVLISKVIGNKRNKTPRRLLEVVEQAVATLPVNQ